MVPDVAEPVSGRQLPDQFYQRTGDESCVQSQLATEPLHRAALDAQSDCAEAKQRGLRVNVRVGAHYPPGSGVGDEEDRFDREGTRNGRRPDRVTRLGRPGNARAYRRTGHVADDRYQDASYTFSVAVCQRDT